MEPVLVPVLPHRDDSVAVHDARAQHRTLQGPHRQAYQSCQFVQSSRKSHARFDRCDRDLRFLLSPQRAEILRAEVR